MGLQYNDEDDGDLFDDDDGDEGEGLASDQPSRVQAKPPLRTVSQVAASRPPAPPGSRRLRMRPMTPSMLQKHPHVVSIMLTRDDGRQLVFVRK